MTKDELTLRSDFIYKMKKIQKQRSIKVEDFAARYGLDS